MDWKLMNEDVRKEPPPSPKIIKYLSDNCKLNKTYNIGKDFPEPEYDAELFSPHNKTFLDEEPASHLELKPAEDPLDVHLAYLTPAQMRQKTENWLTLHGVPVTQEEYADTYDKCGVEDVSAEFVRGAHTAPHSLEIELSVAQDCPCSCNSSLCLLSMRQLTLGIQRHHSALTLLLREQALRESLSWRSFLHLPIPFKVYPTRDTDPLRTPDSVLSRAHRTRPWSHSAIGQCHRHRRGRPYRL